MDNSKPHIEMSPTRAVTKFQRIVAAAQFLEVDYKYFNAGYLLGLRSRLETPKLSYHFALVIQGMQDSEYVSIRSDESIARTVLDLMIVDRLRYVQDKDVFRRPVANPLVMHPGQTNYLSDYH